MSETTCEPSGMENAEPLVLLPLPLGFLTFLVAEPGDGEGLDLCRDFESAGGETDALKVITFDFAFGVLFVLLLPLSFLDDLVLRAGDD